MNLLELFKVEAIAEFFTFPLVVTPIIFNTFSSSSSIRVDKFGMISTDKRTCDAYKALSFDELPFVIKK